MNWPTRSSEGFLARIRKAVPWPAGATLLLTLGCSTLPPTKDAAEPASCIADSLGPQGVLSDSDSIVNRVLSVTPWKQGFITHFQRHDPTKLHSSGYGIEYIGDFVSWRSNEQDMPIVQSIDAEVTCRGGPLPMAGDDVVVCTSFGCNRTGQSGVIWSSPVRLHSHAAGLDAHGLTSTTAFIPWAGDDIPPYAMIALNLADGTTVTTWPLPVIANAVSFHPYQVEVMDDESVFLLGSSIMSLGDDSFRAWIAAANKTGGWAWIKVMDKENSNLNPKFHHLKRTDAGDYLAILSEVEPIFRFGFDDWKRRAFVIRLSANGQQELSRILLPGLMVGNGTPQTYCPDNWISTSVRLEKLTYGRYVVLRTMIDPALWTPWPRPDPDPTDGIYGEGHFIDALGNSLGSFKLPPYDINPPYWLDFNGLEPLLVSSTTCGLRVLWDNSIYNLSAWGHQSAEEAGKCGELTYADCQDNDPCTNDSCDPKLGCIHPPFPDGAACSTTGVCKAGVCAAP